MMLGKRSPGHDKDGYSEDDGDYQTSQEHLDMFLARHESWIGRMGREDRREGVKGGKHFPRANGMRIVGESLARVVSVAGDGQARGAFVGFAKDELDLEVQGMIGLGWWWLDYHKGLHTRRKGQYVGLRRLRGGKEENCRQHHTSTFPDKRFAYMDYSRCLVFARVHP